MLKTSIKVSLQNIANQGFAIIDEIYTQEEIGTILYLIATTNTNKSTFRKSEDLFAIRQLLKEIPALSHHIFNTKLKLLVNEFFGDTYFVVKSIYFDKPGTSNWFVAWHQDLTISVDKKIDRPGYGPWTVKQNQFAVQPPLSILEDNFTVRIHLDDACEDNGALKIIAGSHLKGIYRSELIDWNTEKAITCCVKAGGVMIMRPLLLHASGRTINSQPRKVIHMEFSRAALADGINWSERYSFTC